MFWIALVAGLYAISQLVFVTPSMGLGWDETVYVSQVSPHLPAEFFSAPRSRGITLVVAPLAAVTHSTVALRVYLSLLSALGLFLALLAWRRVRDTRVLALAGALFASLWVAEYYGPQAMPNLWIALAGLAAVGCFLDALRRPAARPPLLGLAAALAVAALMRPSDAAFLGLPLFCLALLRRRLLPLLAVCGGLLAGTAEWIAEAYARFGGIGERLHLSSLNEGGLGLHWAVGDALRSIDGPILCRPCDVSWNHKPLELAVWWLLLPLLVVGGVLVERRAGRLGAALVPALCGLSVAVPYLFLIDYSAPRFLLPAYALLLVPAASLLAWLVTTGSRRRRRALTAVAGLALAGQLTGQYLQLTQEVAYTVASRADQPYVVPRFARLGLTGNCLLTGEDAEPLGYYTGCRAVETSGNDTNITAARLLREAPHQPTALLLYPGDGVPAYARAWSRHTVVGRDGGTDYVVYLAPRG
ncbi:hypothetical protein DN069_32020 [Streptacidiphilus pinicola]|uniref:Glycosyltransferase RgtA/B/C/D-like domain-containing protein n=1 Tax=Streptacidiphilus pinicola TaxID=2219663 RepID=A0A2X0JX65_9ACTN|nr:hypothetical protein [Streptacidiphilus pinicola]RAG81585.1 hypothetical protein DN069_32020 [Streptacidiphilus pinicola]